MVADALESDRLIGMVLLKPGWQADYEGRPAVYPIGCSGVITHVESLADGRYNIVLRGLERFRIVSEDHAKAYRRAVIDRLIETTTSADDRAAVRRQRAKLEAMLAPAIERLSAPARGGRAETKVAVGPSIPSGMADEELVNALAQYLDLEPLEKQALLERRDLRARAESLVELLEMKMLTARHPPAPNVAH
jgi:Lon protease-like protein